MLLYVLFLLKWLEKQPTIELFPCFKFCLYFFHRNGCSFYFEVIFGGDFTNYFFKKWFSKVNKIFSHLFFIFVLLEIFNEEELNSTKGKPSQNPTFSDENTTNRCFSLIKLETINLYAMEPTVFQFEFCSQL